jgi:cyclomaltodextrinase / maltogenic alpha-amylase / neopullulanase
MEDFVFGTLGTEKLRRAYRHALRSGVTHRGARFPRDPLPGQTVELELSLGASWPCKEAWVYWTSDGQDPLGEQGRSEQGQVKALEANGTEWDVLEWGYVHKLRAILPAQPPGTVVRYRLSVVDPRGRETFADQGAYYAYYVDDDPLPEWTRDAILYEIFVDRFSPSGASGWLKPDNPAGFYGGTLLGIAERLDYLANLGVNALWLTPVFPSPSHHGYDATDYFAIEPRLGSEADLRLLLDEAHRKGIRILLDFVANHWSASHPTFQAAMRDRTSPYANWYNFQQWPEAYETFFGVKSLPQINLREPQARQHLLDAAAYWLDFGVDGYRLDYAIGPTPDFWADFRRVTRQKRPDFWTFGEVVEPSDSQIAFHGLLDGCLDFMLLEALRQTFAFGRWDAAHFAAFLNRHEAFFPGDFSRPSFLDNHDMNRFLWTVQGDVRRLKMAALCQFTLAGPPVIYYGTEVGLSQERDVRQGQRGLPEEARLPMLWGEAQDADLLDFYRRLIHLRRQEAALKRGSTQILVAEGSQLAYTRSDQDVELAAVFNLGARRESIHLVGNWNASLLATDSACRLRPGPQGVEIDLPPYSGILLKKESVI